jgi:lipopolysaccharide exporter
LNFIKNILSKIRLFLNTPSLKAKIAKGGFWLAIGSGSENLLRLIRNMILTRILVPDVFGLMAIILAVNFFFEAFTTIGVKESIIQNPKGHQNTYLNSAFWLSAIRGLILFVFGILLTPLIANFYKSPEIIPMMKVSFLGILFQGLLSPKSYSELKGMNYKKWIFLFNGGGIIGVIVAIILSMMFHNIWALVLGNLVERISRTVLSFIFCPFLPRFELERESVNSLFQFASRTTGAPILYFIYNKIDVFVLGKFVSASDLGIYSMAQGLAQTPWLLIGAVISPILLPAFSSTQNNTKLLSSRIFKSTKYIILIFFPLLTLMACNSKIILSIIYGEKYINSSIVFIMFCFNISLLIVAVIVVNALLSIGMPNLERFASLIRFIVISIIIIPFIKYFGTIGAASAIILSTIIYMFTLLIKTKKYIDISLIEYFACLSKGIFLSIIIFIINIFILKVF